MEGKQINWDLDNIFMIIMAGSGTTCRQGWDEAVAKSINPDPEEGSGEAERETGLGTRFGNLKA